MHLNHCPVDSFDSCPLVYHTFYTRTSEKKADIVPSNRKYNSAS
ncbi:hypothetical protein COPCOM_02293 [Coprococcus comes ATCC 27758]|uniref:Uncharacterized protein n=1 Tax=Coprococcus comes ATCC 27758 TaxID=470146 RepID=C0BB37_9FIRM|nr:hypothetical protein COPCOM_02293 [Coprococcus comes ATCC 27758]